MPRRFWFYPKYFAKLGFAWKQVILPKSAVCICTVKKAGGNQISHDSENSAGNSTQIDKQNDNEKEITILIFL